MYIEFLRKETASEIEALSNRFLNYFFKPEWTKEGQDDAYLGYLKDVHKLIRYDVMAYLKEWKPIEDARCDVIVYEESILQAEEDLKRLMAIGTMEPLDYLNDISCVIADCIKSKEKTK